MLYTIRRNESWGYINSSGEVVVPIKADECIPFAEGFGGVMCGNELEIIDASGNSVGHSTEVISILSAKFSNGLLCVCDRNSRNVGYIDPAGRWAVPPVFRNARDFRNQVAIASNAIHSGEGIIDINGNWSCEPKYHRIFDFDGKTSSTIAYSRKPGVALKCMLVDKVGNPVVDDFYDNGHGAGDGLIPVERNSKWGVVNEAGEVVVPFTFDGIDPFVEGLAAAQGADGRFGVIDKSGHWMVHPEFTSIDRFGEGLCAAAKDKQGLLVWGYIDSTGNWVIEPSFGEAYEFNGGLAYVRPLSAEGEGNTFGYIDRVGRYVWEPS